MYFVHVQMEERLNGIEHSLAGCVSGNVTTFPLTITHTTLW